jgi:Flp pilus assembly protein TadD
VGHFALSVIAVLEEDTDEAIRQLERTLELDPEQTLVKNNLAWLLAARESPDLDRAMELANSAVAKAPQIATYRDTLGTILLKRGDAAQAVTDALSVEPAVEHESESKRLHLPPESIQPECSQYIPLNSKRSRSTLFVRNV